MKISIIGSGYVGLVTGACFAEMGHIVSCIDIDAEKIEALGRGVVPIYEPNLSELILSNIKSGRLSFTTSMTKGTQGASVHFIAVGTPTDWDGSADLQYVYAAAKELGACIGSGFNVIVNKSTVPVGTADKVRSIVQTALDLRDEKIEFDVASNPEFLKEGSAIEDFMRPDRVVIGADTQRSAEAMRQLYAPFSNSHEIIVSMGVRDAEMTKYAANAMLATKISFINEIALLCERTGVDVDAVRQGIGSDRRIGHQFINPGGGYGGSCFPKDVRALIQTGVAAGVEPNLLKAVDARNEDQKRMLGQKIMKRFGENLDGKTFALWGLSFKPGTDDMREAPSLILIDQLLSAGAKIKAHDPIAMDAAKKMLEAAQTDVQNLTFHADQYEVLDGADALVLVTDWNPFRNPIFDEIKKRLLAPIIFDGRNQFDPQKMKAQNIEYWGIGRGLA